MEGPVYLDAAGAAIPDKELMRSICEDLISMNFGNPHSVGNAASNDTANRISEARDLVRKHFNVLSEEYDVVFTSGATASMNLVGQSFPWKNGSQMCYPMNSHTSLLGLRDYAPNVHCVPSASLQSTVDHQELYVESILDSTSDYNLLLVPGECNFSGAKADLAYIAQLTQLRGDKLLEHLHATPVKQSLHEDRIENTNPWLWLLDAAKLASTSEVDLSLLPPQQRPHFITISFYKIFGYPTGLGALLIRRDTAHVLQKRYVLESSLVSHQNMRVVCLIISFSALLYSTLGTLEGVHCKRLRQIRCFVAPRRHIRTSTWRTGPPTITLSQVCFYVAMYFAGCLETTSDT